MTVVAKTMRLACRHLFGCSFNMACLPFLLSGGCLLRATARRNGLPRSGVLFGRPGIPGVDLPFERLHESV
ncbi:hypothetical protein AN459_14730 [Pseudomonas aeruginosa]|uniref:hypothetical protein n=1 Tax=Klebsiella pneumoniae TaxID=573 RepID=UPI0003636901|nr:hypothetical protein [Klebsiella pneumoniae]AHB56643.1 hypothetical protein U769_17045 [Pseudomonas aeruginosa MTB-1]AKE70558.1 hypothetical protein YQ19_20785 [Pseudomonas aeruginosa]AKO87363.1 hypothetical protein PA50071_16540 [Pseudomonas aeruginosa DSM 50071 = NBRC 12689]AMA38163.1 hypothetical protein DPADHS01_19560 [Pseudomonas aeruginosa DHS01]ERF07476.1 hypothetical protein PA13_1006730 [Pseudomonas aeruginosa HB13]ESR69664.1 hypothetical protein T266_19900 [Pseudomonas aeruginosa